MVTLVTAVSTLCTVVLVPICAALFGSFVTGGLDLSKITDLFSGLL